MSGNSILSSLRPASIALPLALAALLGLILLIVYMAIRRRPLVMSDRLSYLLAAVYIVWTLQSVLTYTKFYELGGILDLVFTLLALAPAAFVLWPGQRSYVVLGASEKYFREALQDAALRLGLVLEDTDAGMQFREPGGGPVIVVSGSDTFAWLMPEPSASRRGLRQLVPAVRDSFRSTPGEMALVLYYVFAGFGLLFLSIGLMIAFV